MLLGSFRGCLPCLCCRGLRTGGSCLLLPSLRRRRARLCVRPPWGRPSMTGSLPLGRHLLVLFLVPGGRPWLWLSSHPPNPSLSRTLRCSRDARNTHYFPSRADGFSLAVASHVLAGVAAVRVGVSDACAGGADGFRGWEDGAWAAKNKQRKNKQKITDLCGLDGWGEVLEGVTSSVDT